MDAAVTGHTLHQCSVASMHLVGWPTAHLLPPAIAAMSLTPITNTHNSASGWPAWEKFSVSLIADGLGSGAPFFPPHPPYSGVCPVSCPVLGRGVLF